MDHERHSHCDTACLSPDRSFCPRLFKLRPVTQIIQISNVYLAVLLVWCTDRSTTLVTISGTLHKRGEGGQRALFVLSQFVSDGRFRGSSNSVVNRCTTSTQTSERTSPPHRVLTTENGFKSKVFHVSKSMLKEVSLSHGDSQPYTVHNGKRPAFAHSSTHDHALTLFLAWLRPSRFIFASWKKVICSL